MRGASPSGLAGGPFDPAELGFGRADIEGDGKAPFWLHAAGPGDAGEAVAPALAHRGVALEMGDGTAPAAVAAVVGHQAGAKRVVGGGLQRGVEAGADGVAAGGDEVAAIGVDQLAAHFFGDPIAAGDLVRAAEGGGLDRGGFGFLGLGRGDGVIVGHAVEHPVAAGAGGVGEAERVVVVGRLGQRGEEGGFRQREFVERLVEVGGRCGGDAVGLQAEVDLVEVEFEDVFLGHRLVDADGEDQLLCLAGEADLVAQQHVLGDLLGDGRGADRAAAAAVVEHVGDAGAEDADRVDALMGPEPLVFGRNEGLLDHVGDGGNRDEDAPFGGELGEQAVIAGVDAAHHLGLVALQALE